jgi:lysophospholipase L1-like esterase
VKRFLIGLSVLGNVLVLGAAIWFFWAGGMRTVIRNFVQGGYVRLESQFSVLPVASHDVVFLGDSITAGGQWHELFPGVAAKNRGIGGDVTKGVLDRLHQVTSGQPAKLFVKIGTNDLFAGLSEDEIVANLVVLLERVHSESPGTEVYVQSVLPRAVEFRERVESLNRRYEAVAGEHGATWVNLYPLFLDEDGSIRNELANDELHLLGRGYEIWRDAIDAQVRAGLPIVPAEESELPFDEPESAASGTEPESGDSSEKEHP